jgi:hypothetical protein
MWNPVSPPFYLFSAYVWIALSFCHALAAMSIGKYQRYVSNLISVITFRRGLSSSLLTHFDTRVNLAGMWCAPTTRGIYTPYRRYVRKRAYVIGGQGYYMDHGRWNMWCPRVWGLGLEVKQFCPFCRFDPVFYFLWEWKILYSAYLTSHWAHIELVKLQH